MITVARFQVALNHEDPDIVSKGLLEFEKKVLEDNDCVESFGYNGRNANSNISNAVDPHFPVQITGVLSTFINSSPRLEELFVLWNLPGRDEYKLLSTNHTRCIAIILHIARSDRIFCDRIVSRIINEHAKSLQSQLSSGINHLVHASLGLILAMSRTSPENSRNVYVKLLSIFPSVIKTLSQRGKGVTWEFSDNNNNSLSEGNSQKIFKLSTDSRSNK
jgi:GTPase SAR1 family protein